MRSFDGSCFCGSVQIIVRAEPVAMGLPFRAAVHVNYHDTVLRMRDGLPKLQDDPAEMGGSGASVPE